MMLSVHPKFRNRGSLFTFEGTVAIVLGDLKLRRCSFRGIFFFSLLKRSLKLGVSMAMLEFDAA